MIQITAYRLNVKLDNPITISFHTWRFIENVLVSLRFRDLEGLGEAAPFKPITGDSQEELVSILRELPVLEIDPQKDSLDILHAFLEKRVPSQTLKAAIDFAYHDLLGKMRNVPCYRLYAKRPTCVPNTITLFIQSSPSEVERAAAEIFKKYPHLKILKIKLKGENDLERVRAIRGVAPAGMAYTLDANQGFVDPRAAVSVINGIVAELGNVLLAEEPCPKGQLEKLRYVKENVEGTLIFADESAATLDDARRVIAAQAAHGINIKLQKAGGIWPGKLIAGLCEKAKLRVMVGSMLEGPLANMAGVHFVASTPQAMISDLDMDLEMPEHVQGRAAFVNGVRLPNQGSGFGIHYDHDRIRSMMQSGTLIYERII